MASSQSVEHLRRALGGVSNQCEDLRSMSHKVKCESATLKERIDELASQMRQLSPDDERYVAIAKQMAVMKSNFQALKSRQVEVAGLLEYYEQQQRELQQQLDDMTAAP